MKLEELKQAIEILKEVQKKYPEAILAGGYLRDLFFGKEFKDVDIFVNSKLSSEAPSYNFIRTKSCNMSYSTDNEIQEVQYYSYISNSALIEVNLIEVQCDSVVERVQEHDFDFCQVYTDGTNTYGMEILQQVLDTNTVTLVQCENALQWKRSMQRWDRFKEKYPEFKLKIKEGIYCETI